MGSILILISTVILVLVSAFIVLIVLMQRPSANSGMGSALGGGAAESAFGAQTGNILTRATIVGCVAFFLLAFCLYLGHMSGSNEEDLQGNSLTHELSAAAEAESSESPAVDADAGLAKTIKAEAEQESTEDAEVDEFAIQFDNKGDAKIENKLPVEAEVSTDPEPEEAPAVEIPLSK